MGLLYTLPKESSVNYQEVKNAYWAIDNIMLGKGGDGKLAISFDFIAYASREAKQKERELDTEASHPLQWGGFGMARKTSLYKFSTMLPVTDLFEESMPSSIEGIKKELYHYIKRYLKLEGYIDVLEEGQEV